MPPPPTALEDLTSVPYRQLPIMQLLIPCPTFVARLWGDMLPPVQISHTGTRNGTGCYFPNKFLKNPQHSPKQFTALHVLHFLRRKDIP